MNCQDGDDKERERNRATRVSKDFKDPSTRNGSNKNTQGNNGPIDPSTLKFKTSFRNTIYDVLMSRGWKPTESDMDWDMHWAERDWMVETFDHAHLESWQRVNHFRNDRELCRKDLLIKNVKRHRRNLEREKKYEEAERYNFCPTTFVLPGEYALFVETFKKHPNNTWIMKPIGRSQGKGIFLFRSLNQISKWRSEHRWKPENSEVEQYVVQSYINNPFLVGGKKFDLRIYAMVTSYSPLVVYLHRSGFARFSNYRYSSLASDISNNYVHLTNVSVQKGADNYNKETGGKWVLRSLKMYLISRFGSERVDKLFKDIQDIVIRSLISVQKVMINDKHCFELYGYDIMIDDQLKPWLIEVNASPSLSSNTDEDFNLKFRMLNDAMDIVDLERRLKGDEERVGGFDLVYSEGNTKEKPKSLYTSFLGCEIPPMPRSTYQQLHKHHTQFVNKHQQQMNPNTNATAT